jgi:hypothetical protein
MPSSSEILKSLTLISNSYIWLAVLWHGVVFAALARKGWRPRQRHAAQLLLLPLLSVSVLAWIHGNPFNGLMFLALIVIFGLISLKLANRPVTLTRKWTFPVGFVVLHYALFYPHFLVGKSPWLYLIAAPVGLVPCPTLSLVLGFTLIFSGFHSRAWQAVCAAAGLFYALFGILILGVWLDIGLLLTAASMLILMTERQELSLPDGSQAKV